MRVVVEIPDERPEARILREAEDPEAFLLNLVREWQAERDEVRIPDYVALLDRARTSPHRFQTREEADAYLREIRED